MVDFTREGIDLTSFTSQGEYTLCTPQFPPKVSLTFSKHTP